MPKLDFIVVGAGLAGSLLAWELISSGKSVAIIADSTLPTSSQVAGGLINPVTGKYLAKTWLAIELFPKLDAFYSQLEKQFKSKFYHKIGLFRPFKNEEHKNNSLTQIQKHSLEEYIQVLEDAEEFNKNYEATLGGMYSKDAGWVDVPLMLDLLHSFFKENATWVDEPFDYSKLQVNLETVNYKQITAEKTIFCEGYYVKDNPFFSWLPFNPVKGETLVGKIDDYALLYIVNQGKWVIPIGNNELRLGATYSWHQLDFLPTEEGRRDLMNVANKILKQDFLPLRQYAGVRPATKDRRPILGKHPAFSPLFIFNGLGTKGVSLAPFFAQQLVENLLKNELLYPEVNIERFYTLYS